VKYLIIRAAAIAGGAVAAISILSGGAVIASAATQPSAAPSASSASSATVKDACPVAAPGRFTCYALVRTDVHGGTGLRGSAAVAAGHPADAPLPSGYEPSDLRAAYKLPASGGSGQTVAIVDAGDDPDAEADLAIYRATYSLPPCTTANGCFRKVNEGGEASPLPQDQSWGVEISLDLDMVSAACPSCHILLVEGDSASFSDLAAAEDTATRLGANEVSNSYGATEQNGMQRYEAAYSRSGVAITASSGDLGWGIPNFPAVLPTVIAVGGTTLTRAADARGWAEAAWAGSSSGCSAWIPKPAWQHDPDCPGRMVADVASDADPSTGVAVYDSYDGNGWVVGGGTSAASPFIAGVIALAGNPAKLPNASYLYTHARTLNDVVTGSNTWQIPWQTQCGGDYLCTAVPGYDGPTGNGTPRGSRAF
jgi:subtilase family serine protease